MFVFEKQFRREKPETIGETDSVFDLDNYKDWLEEKLSLYVKVMEDVSRASRSADLDESKTGLLDVLSQLI